MNCYSTHGSDLKNLFDVEKEFLGRYLYITWNKEGLFTEQISDNGAIYVRSQMLKDDFEEFQCETNITLQLNLDALWSAIRTLKKKDSFRLSIDDIDDGILKIQCDSTENILNFSLEDCQFDGLPENGNDYDWKCKIQPIDYLKMGRSIKRSKTVEAIFVMYPSGGCFIYLAGTYSKQIFHFGVVSTQEKTHSDNMINSLTFPHPENNDDSEQKYYMGTFPSSIIKNSVKLAALGNSISISVSENSGIPICIKNRNKYCGSVSLLIKSNEYREAEIIANLSEEE